MTKQDQYQAFKCEALGCRKCSLGEEELDGYDPHVVGQGDLNAPVLFVAEAPGLQETIYHRPLTSPGKSGVVYERLLASLNLTRDQVYTTNTVLCRPLNNRDPLPYECIVCRPWLVAQLELVRPKLVVAFGRFAAATFIPTNFKITRDHGRLLHSAVFGVDVFPLYHPAFVSCYAKIQHRQEFKSDVATLKRLLKGYNDQPVVSIGG